MMIRIDPAEMSAASDTLRSSATESADIGAQLWSCVQCAMPANIHSAVDQLIVAADRALDVSAGVVANWAGDLMRRGDLARNQSLEAAITTSPVVSATVPAGAIVGGGNPYGTISTGSAQGILGGTMTIGGTSIYDGITPMGGGTMTIGGTSIYDGITPMGGGTMTIGGTSIYDGITPMGGGTMTIGGPTAGSQNPFMALARVADANQQRAQARIDAIVRNPSSTPAAVGFALDAQWEQGNGIRTLLAPSRREIEDKYFHGKVASITEIQKISPNTT